MSCLWPAATACSLLASLALGLAPVGDHSIQAMELRQGAQPRPGSAFVVLRNANGADLGVAILTEGSEGVQLQMEVRDLPPGEHGIHIHEVGRCDAPDFLSAGEHFNPGLREHGLRNLEGAHAGDLPNLQVGPDGTASYTATVGLLSLGLGNPAAFPFDTNGAALIIHADADDQVSNPAGNSGARIACGVLRLS